MTFLGDYIQRSEVFLTGNKIDVPIEFKPYLAYDKRSKHQCHHVKPINTAENCPLELQKRLADQNIMVEITIKYQHQQKSTPQSFNCDFIDNLRSTFLSVKFNTK